MTPDKIVRSEQPASSALSAECRQTPDDHTDDSQSAAAGDMAAEDPAEPDQTDETTPVSAAEQALACDATPPAPNATHPDRRAWWEDSAPIAVAPQMDAALAPDRTWSTSDQPASVASAFDTVFVPCASDAPTEPLSLLTVQPATRPFSAATTFGDDQDPALDVQDTHMLDAERMPTLIHQRSVQGLAATALRDVGRMRQENQDSVFALLTTLPRDGLDVPMGLFVVADGMGGHDRGEVASRLAVRTVVHEVIAQLVLPALDNAMSEALQPMMIAAVQEANRVIWDQAQMLNSDMGTTCTAALLLGHALYIAHVGDSRAYILEAGGLRCLTDDHSAVGRLIQLGQLDPAAARNHPLRSQLYRTVGQQPHVQVDFIYHPLGDSTHLLFCSDGLWSMVSEDQLQQALEQHRWPHDACAELIALANLAGGEDNIAAVVVTLPIAERPSG